MCFCVSAHALLAHAVFVYSLTLSCLIYFTFHKKKLFILYTCFVSIFVLFSCFGIFIFCFIPRCFVSLSCTRKLVYIQQYVYLIVSSRRHEVVCVWNELTAVVWLGGPYRPVVLLNRMNDK